MTAVQARRETRDYAPDTITNNDQIRPNHRAQHKYTHRGDEAKKKISKIKEKKKRRKGKEEKKKKKKGHCFGLQSCVASLLYPPKRQVQDCVACWTHVPSHTTPLQQSLMAVLASEQNEIIRARPLAAKNHARGPGLLRPRTPPPVRSLPAFPGIRCALMRAPVRPRW